MPESDRSQGKWLAALVEHLTRLESYRLQVLHQMLAVVQRQPVEHVAAVRQRSAIRYAGLSTSSLKLTITIDLLIQINLLYSCGYLRLLPAWIRNG